MEYDRGDVFSFDFEKNKIPFGSKSEVKFSPRSYSIRIELETYFTECFCQKNIFLIFTYNNFFLLQKSIK